MFALHDTTAIRLELSDWLLSGDHDNRSHTFPFDRPTVINRWILLPSKVIYVGIQQQVDLNVVQDIFELWAQLVMNRFTRDWPVWG